MPEYKVKIDDKRVKQIFINLLSNASKFTTKGSIRFYVEEMRAIGDGMLKFVPRLMIQGMGYLKRLQILYLSHFNLRIRLRGRG